MVRGGLLDVLAGRVERRALLLGIGLRPFQRLLLQAELLDRDLRPVQQLPVRVGRRAGVRRTRAELGRVTDVECGERRAVAGAHVQLGTACRELGAHRVALLTPGVECALGGSDPLVGLLDRELRAVVLLVEDRDAVAVGLDLRFELRRLVALGGELRFRRRVGRRCGREHRGAQRERRGECDESARAGPAPRPRHGISH